MSEGKVLLYVYKVNLYSKNWDRIIRSHMLSTGRLMILHIPSAIMIIPQFIVPLCLIVLNDRGISRRFAPRDPW